jgi:hypothetical protein
MASVPRTGAKMQAFYARELRQASDEPRHPRLDWRTVLQAGAIGLLRLGLGDVGLLRAAGAAERESPDAKPADLRDSTVALVPKASSVIDFTLFDMAGEFGWTTRISTLPQYYKLSGRDH